MKNRRQFARAHAPWSPPGWRPLLTLLLVIVLSGFAPASDVRLRNGFTLDGDTFNFKAIADGYNKGLKGASPGDPITVVTDVMRRYYVPRNAIEEFKPGRDEPLEKF